ncbi:MAG: RNA-binding protein [Kiloniellales bacterium]
MTEAPYETPRSRARATRPERRCIASGQVRPKEELLRFVAGPDGRIVPDLSGRLPGRGLWLTPRRDMMKKACERNLFAKAAKAPVRVPDDLIGQVDRLMASRCLELLGLARRAGAAVAGYEKAASWLAAGKAGALFQAVDAAEGGRRKLRALARAAGPHVPVIELFTAEELGRALGRGAAVHVAVAPAGILARLTRETARLSALRGGPLENGDV